MIKARYLVGIDLGTTNTVVAYADLEQGLEQATPTIFPVEQLIASGTVAAKNQLPSFRYHPASEEISEAEQQLPWFAMPIRGDIESSLTGVWARDLGAKVDGRLVASAKSWLCHDGVDRTAAILPWGSDDEVEKVSPLVASSSYLAHVKSAWNCAHPEYPLELQDVVITIPASFDDVARGLTLQAAEMAGYMNVHLIEEPQAACYHWYAAHREQMAKLLANTGMLLVCDVGGGTTDLSLIKVSDQEGSIQLERVAVGEHIMLGGDNIDLALAHQAERQLLTGSGKRLNAGALSQLIQQCRQVKESLLQERAPVSAKATVLGAGARLIGGARSVEFSQDQVRALALDGFLPLTNWGEVTQKQRSAIVEFGLPFSADPAISRHIYEFLAQHQGALAAAFPQQTQGPWVPDAILFNGGFFNSQLLRDRAQQLLSRWRGGEVQVLANADPDLAVAYGAVAYGLARRGAFAKIAGGAPRSYFLALEDDSAICLLPKGTPENQELLLEEKTFLLTLGQPVSFQLLTSSGDQGYQAGELINFEAGDKQFIRMPPSQVKVDQAAGKSFGEIQVLLASQLTDVGTLSLDCVALENQRQRWQLSFDLRKPQSRPQGDGPASAELPQQFPQAQQSIHKYYGGRGSSAKGEKLDVRQLRNELERLLGKRDDWDIALLRGLYDTLFESAKRRRRSDHHERTWFHLAGFCLRPGLGASGDEFRVDSVWPFYETGMQYPKETRAWAEWWTFWRRLSAGLSADQQQRIYQDIAGFIDPENSASKKIKAQARERSYEDMLRLSGSLEKLPLVQKKQLGQWLVQRLQKTSESVTAWWTLGRVASRELLYAGVDSVLSPEQIKPWIGFALQQDWQKLPEAGFAVVMMARKTDDRARDLENELREQILARLVTIKAPDSWLQLVAEHVDTAETNAVILGESLPFGIRLLDV